MHEGVTSLLDEKSYNVTPFDACKLKEIKETGLAPSPSPTGFRLKAQKILMIVVLYAFYLTLGCACSCRGHLFPVLC
ncbi:hypothetical protein RHGRI_021306 [Rhododendron griersonianum]|uniref:Uncharacterized protein n=1 Tax=Rhododendron griersonianum TaxID=479676 RepID=A0AAV6JN70_9ERIC|nr:hypothetical protein RHGRI_021306 [Rhododendron griersonianum]